MAEERKPVLGGAPPPAPGRRSLLVALPSLLLFAAGIAMVLSAFWREPPPTPLRKAEGQTTRPRPAEPRLPPLFGPPRPTEAEVPRQPLPVPPPPAPATPLTTPSTPWRTLPADTLLTRIGFGSCLDQRLPMPIWTSILDARPQLFLMMGDNVYGDVSSEAMTELRDAYRRLLAHPHFARARATLPFLATWDDHDYGGNDADSRFPHKAEAARMFHAFWQTRPDPGVTAGIHSARTFGPAGRRVQIILLDMRSFRSALRLRPAADRALDRAGGTYQPDTANDRTMLGEAQWAWLEARLREPAEIRLLVSSIQVLAETHGWERWGQLPRERERLVQLIRRTGAKGVVLLSGDRHRAAMYRRVEGLDYPLVEVTASSLNRPFPAVEPADPGRLGEMYGAANFGLAEIDWTGRRLRLSLKSQLGIDVQPLTLDFAALGHGG